jgi:hypothetical protein
MQATELTIDLVPGGKAFIINTPGGYATVATTIPSCNSTIYAASNILFPCCFSLAMLDVTPEMAALYNSKNSYVIQFATTLRGMFTVSSPSSAAVRQALGNEVQR